MTDVCDLRRSFALEVIYEPRHGGRGLKVYLCKHCARVQSLPPRGSHARTTLAA